MTQEDDGKLWRWRAVSNATDGGVLLAPAIPVLQGFLQYRVGGDSAMVLMKGGLTLQQNVLRIWRFQGALAQIKVDQTAAGQIKPRVKALQVRPVIAVHEDSVEFGHGGMPAINRRFVHGRNAVQRIAIALPVDGIEQGVFLRLPVASTHGLALEIVAQVPTQRTHHRARVQQAANQRMVQQARAAQAGAIDHDADIFPARCSDALVDGGRRRGAGLINAQQSELIRPALPVLPNSAVHGQ